MDYRIFNSLTLTCIIYMNKSQNVCKESGQKGLNLKKINVSMRSVFFGRPDSKPCLCKRTKQ